MPLGGDNGYGKNNREEEGDGGQEDDRVQDWRYGEKSFRHREDSHDQGSCKQDGSCEDHRRQDHCQQEQRGGPYQDHSHKNSPCG